MKTRVKINEISKEELYELYLKQVEKCEELVGAGNVEVVGHDSYNKKATGEAIVKIVVNVPPTTSATDVQNSAQAVLATENLIAIYGSNQGGVDGILAASNDGSDFNKENGTHIVSVSEIHHEPMGIYSSNHTSLDDIKNSK